ncbi:endoplasmic reticulum vesicle transporter-domain-containing protein [Paraphysoderma sedebokerense]|nr:endoplasmic reticulum vesicle transporter-domain-containing protein [Paraphysoderma sedebokerense]
MTLRLRRLSTFDAFPKVDAHYTAPTSTGGLTSILVSFFLFFLFLSEFSAYRTLHQSYEFLVDASKPVSQDLGWLGGLIFGLPTSSEGVLGLLNVNLDITVAMDCMYLAVDVLDAGGLSLNVKNEIKSEDAVFNTNGVEYLKPTKPKSQPLSHILNSSPSSSSSSSHEASTSNHENKACRFYGSFKVNKVAGTLHLTALGHGRNGQHTPHDAFNFTHRIDKLSFGVDYPNIVNPLSKTYISTNEQFEMFQYYLNIIPTIYMDHHERVTLTNQYAVTDYHRVIDHEKGSHGMPGVFMKYDVEPLTVRITEYRTPFLTFLTRICGIIGGMYVCAGLVHSLGEKAINGVKNLFGLETGKVDSRRSGAGSSGGVYTRVMGQEKKAVF